LKFGTSCMILMLFACFFYSNMFGYGSVTFWNEESMF
jgi:hypothetical protein